MPHDREKQGHGETHLGEEATYSELMRILEEFMGCHHLRFLFDSKTNTPSYYIDQEICGKCRKKVNQAHTAITKYFEGYAKLYASGLVPEEKPNMFSYDEGWNACRTEILRRIGGEK